jgi:hypothetical protein
MWRATDIRQLSRASSEKQLALGVGRNYLGQHAGRSPQATLRPLRHAAVQIRPSRDVRASRRDENQGVVIRSYSVAYSYRSGPPGLVLYKDLARAVKREAACAVKHWWGVGASTVNKWRRALGVTSPTEGEHRLKSTHGEANASRTIPKAVAKAIDPERRAMIAAAKRGKPRPPSVLKALRKANVWQQEVEGDAGQNVRRTPEAWHSPVLSQPAVACDRGQDLQNATAG